MPKITDDLGVRREGSVFQELRFIAKSYKLDSLDMRDIQPRFAYTVVYPAFLTLQILLVSSVLSIFSAYKTMDFIDVSIVFAAIIIYSFGSSYVYRLFLKRERDHPYLSYVYVCMYSLTYLPLALFIAILLGPLGTIPMFVMALVTRFNASGPLLHGYSFNSEKQKFLFSIISFSLQVIFTLGLGMYVVKSVGRNL